MIDVDEDRLDLLFGALADRTRRALVARLTHSSASISQLAEPFRMSLPAVSKHLRVLERAGLVQRTVEGRVHRCTLDPGPLHDAERWLNDYEALWHHQLDSLAAYVATDPT
jgi:DNA-binding transcriptional ArsR family regulator